MVSPKTYNMLDYSKDNVKKALKGVSHRNNTLRHEHLLKAVYDGETTTSKECKFRINKKKCTVETIHQTRNSINPLFTKLKLDNDRITISPLLFVDENGDEIFV